MYLRRGELHRQHGAWAEANSDYNRAISCDESLEIVRVARSRLLLQTGQSTTALEVLAPYVTSHPRDLQARILRAGILAELGNHLPAAAEYTSAIQLQSPADPELYISRARALANAGDDYLGQAVSGLDEGITALGELITLELLAVELDRKAGENVRAEKRLLKMASRATRKDGVYARLGEFYKETNHPLQAREAWTSATHELEALPVRIRNTSATRELAGKLRRELDNLTSPTKSATP
ncbi:MAG: tetratricopeptide repeat protein [Candidatus Sumerlaeaceae bacterium]|nr:tetratricopeptide repeat protein [Candidatus Sumerlaeaceae bacterium]